MHRRQELISIDLHALVAERLTPEVLDHARSQLGSNPAGAEWEELLQLPTKELQARLVEDSPEMRRLRQSSPFAGVLSEQERLEVLARHRQ
jgi:hypothetical protein